jgi:hypothetical protein
MRYLLFLLGLAACQSTPTPPPALPQAAPVAAETAAPEMDDNEYDTLFTLHYPALSVEISGLGLYETDQLADTLRADTTLVLDAAVGTTVEAAQLRLWPRRLSDIRVDMRYETSLTVMNEGPHCDLLDWKHYLSDWAPAQAIGPDLYRLPTCDESDAERFPKVSPQELREAVVRHCGAEWGQLPDSIQRPTQYPLGVGISRFFLRIRARDAAGRPWQRLIEIIQPMGC